jgi:aryl-alcohol dehydrogenase-like predicted oxidoreductase
MSAASAGALRLGGELEVNRLGFGAMRITGPGIWGEPADRERAKAVLRRALELEVNLIDTADSYGPHVSEELIAEALHPYPEGLVIATKAGLRRPGPHLWDADGRPEYLRACLEASLRRLRLDRIDLFQLHRPDPAVPFLDSVGALAELRQQGKIRHIGLSNVSVEQLDAARTVTPIASVQNRFNLADRADERTLEACEQDGISYLPWAPMGAGRLETEALQRIAAAHGATPAQVALAWLLARSPMTLPIPGTGSIRHLEENVGAAELRLGSGELDAVVEVTAGDRARRLGERVKRRLRHR